MIFGPLRRNINGFRSSIAFLLLIGMLLLLGTYLSEVSNPQRYSRSQKKLRQGNISDSQTLDDVIIPPVSEVGTHNVSHVNNSTSSQRTLLSTERIIAIRGSTSPIDGQTDSIVYERKPMIPYLKNGMFDEDGDYVDYVSNDKGDVNNKVRELTNELPLTWVGKICGHGSLLNHPNLTNLCEITETATLANDGTVTENGTLYFFKHLPRRLCYAINQSKHGHQKPTCGHWQIGTFLSASEPTREPTPLSSQIMSVALTNLNQKKQSAQESFCTKPTFYSSVIVDSDFTILTQERPDPSAPLVYPFLMAHKRCHRNFTPVNNLDTLAILYKHVYSAEAPLTVGGNSSNGTLLNTKLPRGILFSGDSLTRNLFHTLIAHIRNEPVTAEHYYHRDALYVVYPSGDLFVQLNSGTKRQFCGILRTFFGGYQQTPKKCHWKTALGPLNEWPLIAVLYMWDVSPAKHRGEVMSMRNLGLQIGGYAYWWYATNDTSLEGKGVGVKNAKMNVQIDPYLEELSKTMAKYDTKRKLVWMTTPLVSRKHALGPVLGPLGERNSKMARWVRDGTSFTAPLTVRHSERNFHEDPFTGHTKAGSAIGEKYFYNQTARRYLFDLAGFADVMRTSNVTTRDGLHYPCSWSPQSPAQITRLRSNAFHCRDPLNSNALQWLLHMLLFL